MITETESDVIAQVVEAIRARDTATATARAAADEAARARRARDASREDVVAALHVARAARIPLRRIAPHVGLSHQRLSALTR